jgi:hypothetical protein
LDKEDKEMSEYTTTLTETEFEKHREVIDGFVFYQKKSDGVHIKTSSRFAIDYLKNIKR